MISSQRDSSLLVDQRRVILDPHSTKVWSARVIGALSECVPQEGIWPSVFSLANIAAYHLSRAGERETAEKLLVAQLLRAQELVACGHVEQALMAFDAQLNRIRLASIHGEEHTAFLATGAMLTGQSDQGECAQMLELWNNLALPLTQDARRALEVERLLIEWRYGGLDADGLKVYLDSDRTYLRPLLLELYWRTVAEQGMGSMFIVQISDTLKRAMHRFAVWSSIYSDSSLGQSAIALLDRAFRDFSKIKFVCPSTPARWAHCITTLSRLDKERRERYQKLFEKLNDTASQEARRNTSRLLAWSEKSAPPTTGSLSEMSLLLAACVCP